MISYAAYRQRCYRRRASSYIFFVGAAMVVAIIGVSALMTVRIQWRSAESSNDLTAARFCAQTAIEFAFVQINQDRTWRTNLGAGFWGLDHQIGGGLFNLEATFIDDGDGNPNNDDVVLTGIGVYGQATHRVQCTLVAQNAGVVISPGSWERPLN